MHSSTQSIDQHWLLGRHARRRVHYQPYDVTPQITPTPRTLLIDNDIFFAYAFEKFAKRYHVPVRWLDSVVAPNNGKLRNYDLVLLDRDSCGGEFVLDVATEIREANANIPIVVIGYEEPQKVEMLHWQGIIQGFTNKDFGVESVFNDAVKIYVTGVEYSEPKTAGSDVR